MYIVPYIIRELESLLKVLQTLRKRNAFECKNRLQIDNVEQNGIFKYWFVIITATP